MAGLGWLHLVWTFLATFLHNPVLREPYIIHVRFPIWTIQINFLDPSQGLDPFNSSTPLIMGQLFKIFKMDGLNILTLVDGSTHVDSWPIWNLITIFRHGIVLTNLIRGNGLLGETRHIISSSLILDVFTWRISQHWDVFLVIPSYVLACPIYWCWPSTSLHFPFLV